MVRNNPSCALRQTGDSVWVCAVHFHIDASSTIDTPIFFYSSTFYRMLFICGFWATIHCWCAYDLTVSELLSWARINCRRMPIGRSYEAEEWKEKKIEKCEEYWFVCDVYDFRFLRTHKIFIGNPLLAEKLPEYMLRAQYNTPYSRELLVLAHLRREHNFAELVSDTSFGSFGATSQYISIRSSMTFDFRHSCQWFIPSVVRLWTHLKKKMA